MRKRLALTFLLTALTLTPPLKVSGRGEVSVIVVASDPTGEPLANSVAYLDGKRLNMPLGFVKVGLKPGYHNLTIYWKGFRVYSGRVLFDKPMIYRLPCEVYSLRVYVEDWLGRPLRGLPVLLEGGKVEELTTSGLRGLALFKKLPKGNYRLICDSVRLKLSLEGDESLRLRLPPPLPIVLLALGLACCVALVLFYVVKRYC